MFTGVNGVENRLTQFVRRIANFFASRLEFVHLWNSQGKVSDPDKQGRLDYVPVDGVPPRRPARFDL
ncbi:unnamed protein product [marine sediment metagenome]|uniref:Uncharacterized protein n=1 Tax=marine sediment metagenome TaxID=412755 RepID=X0S8I3_9ZZZZ